MRVQSHIAAFLAVATFSGVLSCSRRTNPETTFDQAWNTFQSGDLVRAQAESEKGYDEYHSVSPDWAWEFAILKARILYQRGMYDEGLKLLGSVPATLPAGDLEVKKLWIQGLLYIALHDFPSAEQELAGAEAHCASSQSSFCKSIPGARGALEMQRGRYADAQTFFERALALARANGDHSWEANALLDLSWSTLEQTHFDTALDWAIAARQASIAQGLAGNAETALGNMGWAYYKLGEPERAEGMFSDAERQAEKMGYVEDQVRWLLDLGYVYSDSGNVSAAEQSYRQSLNLARKIKSREGIINALQALAFVSEQTGKLDDAKHYADEALSMAREDGNKRDEAYPLLVQGRIGARQGDSTAAEAAFHQVEQSPDSPVFLKWEAQHSLALLYEDENETDAARREYHTALNTFESARSELQHETSRLPFLNNASGIYDDYIRFLVTHGKTDEALQVAEYQRGRTLAEGLGLLGAEVSKTGVSKTGASRTESSKTASLQKAAFNPGVIDSQAAARHAGGTILFYSLGEKQSYLWAITPRKTTLFTLPAKAEMDAIVQRYRKMLANQQEFLPQAGADARTLYRMLVAPAQTMLPKDTKVFIIPDGSLNMLNFETLLVDEPNDPKPHYWIEDATIADASSLHVLAAAASTHRKGISNLLLMGNAVATSADYPELGKASIEMESIGKHFPADRQQVLSREGATPAAYLESKPGQFSYIHFVAHGTASRTSPLDSAIVLSSASQQDDSFKLYARDIIQQKLHAELVTISTCYGAGARAYSGEGLVGLSWAFLRAGSHNVIGALWEVSDTSTPQLMDALYASLTSGQSPDSALRAAKLALLHSSRFSKPFYWAPFQLYTGS